MGKPRVYKYNPYVQLFEGIKHHYNTLRSSFLYAVFNHGSTNHGGILSSMDQRMQIVYMQESISIECL